jgi:predicted nuclease of restriction endonuclease-like (RecB) superfamily
MSMKRPRRKTSRPATGLPARTGLAGYPALLIDLKQRIRTAQIRAALSVNRELIQLYWDIGRAIVLKQQQERWGAAVIDKLAADLQREFPDLKGFSRTNIYRMKAFFSAHQHNDGIVPQAVGQLDKPSQHLSIIAKTARQLRRAASRSIVPQLVGQLPQEQPAANLAQAVRDLDSPPEPMASLPWGHNTIWIESLPDPATRLWYARKALENGWSRNMLAHWIDSKLHAREGKAITNFKSTLLPAQSDLALQILKDPYNFDFLTLAADADEKALETGLLEQLTCFLLELGEGFAFVGRQMRFEVDGEDFSIDLLFYHLRLRAFVVIDLKTGKFLPEHAGKMNFYLSMIDDQMRTPADAPTIGLILCRTKSRIIAEYALRHTQRPVGVAGYQVTLTDKLPKALAANLPSIKQIERELSRTSSAGHRKRRR